MNDEPAFLQLQVYPYLLKLQANFSPMKLPSLLYKGTLIRRYKRFIADVRLENGSMVSAHCPNSGSMLTSSTPGSLVLLSRSSNTKRKFPFTLELYKSENGWVLVDTLYPNKVAVEGIMQGRIKELTGYERIKMEASTGDGSRLDILLEGKERPQCYVEIKNCTLLSSDGTIEFPDAVTSRGLKHLRTLSGLVKQGKRGVMLFFLGRTDGFNFRPADHIDSAYGKGLRDAAKMGVEILAYKAHITPEEISIKRPEKVFL